MTVTLSDIHAEFDSSSYRQAELAFCSGHQDAGDSTVHRVQSDGTGAGDVLTFSQPVELVLHDGKLQAEAKGPAWLMGLWSGTVVGRGIADVSKGGAHQRIDLKSDASSGEELVGIVAFTVTAGTGGGGSPLSAGGDSSVDSALQHPESLQNIYAGGALAFTAGNCGNPNQHQEHSVHQHSETESYTSTVN